jgi:hypothetical protein
MSTWIVGETRIVAGVPHKVVVCAGKCKQKILVHSSEKTGPYYCMDCANLGSLKASFGGVGYDHKSDSNYHGGHSE